MCFAACRRALEATDSGAPAMGCAAEVHDAQAKLTEEMADMKRLMQEDMAALRAQVKEQTGLLRELLAKQ